MSEVPTHGKCQSGRTSMLSHRNQVMCSQRALPGKFYCDLHQKEAMARLPDRSIGDNKPLKWTAWTTMSRGDN